VQHEIAFLHLTVKVGEHTSNLGERLRNGIGTNASTDTRSRMLVFVFLVLLVQFLALKFQRRVVVLGVAELRPFPLHPAVFVPAF
jgi:hypothetical protein